MYNLINLHLKYKKRNNKFEILVLEEKSQSFTLKQCPHMTFDKRVS